MKIIKKKEFGLQKFVCDNCDSEFESLEYGIHKTIDILGHHFFRGTEVLPVYSLSLKCPVCEHGVSNRIPTGEPPYRTWLGDL